MRCRLGLLACLLAGLVCGAGLGQTPTFRAETSVVRVDFEVLDKLAPVGGLTVKDLVVKDEGRPQAVQAMAEGELPLDLVLLFDVSGSMDSLVERVGASAETAFAQLQPGDRVAVMVFNDSTRLLLRLTEDHQRALRVVRERVVGGYFDGGTSLLAGVDDAAKYLLSAPRGARRRAIVVVTDNRGVRSRRQSTVVNRLWEADATVHAIVFTTRAQTVIKWYTRVAAPHVELLISEGVNGAADKTGGTILAGRDPAGALPELIRRIRARPVLYYAMPEAPAGAFRKIQVELTGEAKRRYPNARIYARRGYHVPDPAKPGGGQWLEGITDDEATEEEDDEEEEFEKEEEPGSEDIGGAGGNRTRE